MGSRSSWFANFYDENFLQLVENAATQAQAAEEIDFLLSKIKLSDKGRIADIGCGTGRHVLEMAARGLDVWGFDLNPEFIATAILDLPSETTANFVCADMRDALPRDFDLICSFYNSIGFFSDEENQSCLDRWARDLNPKGYLYLDLWNAAPIRAHPRSERSFGLPNGGTAHEQGELSEDARFVDRTYTYRTGVGKPVIRKTRFRLYSQGEIESCLSRAEFSISNQYGAIDGSTFAPDSPRMITIAQID